MTGLVRTAGAFFSFLAIVFMGFLSLASFFRLLGCVSFDFNVAARLAASLVTVMVIYSGYIIPVFSMKRWLFWLYYANPVVSLPPSPLSTRPPSLKRPDRIMRSAR